MASHRDLPPEARRAVAELFYGGPGPEYGGWAEIVAGPHKGRYGVYTETILEYNGRPERIMVRTRDAREDQLIVRYQDTRPATAGRR